MANKTDEELITYFAGEVVQRRLTTAAIFFLEALKPLNLIGSQALIFLEPILKLFFTLPHYREIIQVLEKRENLEKLIIAIEAAENQLQYSECRSQEPKVKCRN